MVPGAPDRGGGRRGGFGAGRHGRTGGRSPVWQPVGYRGVGGGRGGGEGDAHGGRGGGWEGAALGGRGRGRGSGDGDEGSSSNWGHQEEMNSGRKEEEPEIPRNPQQQDQIPKGEGKQPRQPADQKELTSMQNSTSDNGYKCRDLKNHTSENCNRRMHCELCGLNNHTSFECKREPLWNCAPELCAAQVTDQSFFYIDEKIDSRASKEKASTAIISVVSGSVTAKQIENEFRNEIHNGTWIWSAKQISKNKFSMRFPNAKMVQDWRCSRPQAMKTVEAQFVIGPWSPSIGAKGELQHAWFKVSGIPPDQRSLRTIAKVGGLVGKTLEIDEKTRYSDDYVRMRIACRDVTQVPEVAESSLGLFIYDFFFEREMVEPAQQPISPVGASKIDICETWRLRGNEAYTKGRLTEAEECYTHGIDSFSPNEGSRKALMLCYSNRAATRMSQGKMREALSDCRKATDIDSSFLKAQVRTAKCLLALGDVEEAQKAFEMCLKSNHLSSLDHKTVKEASDGLQKAKKISDFILQSKEYLIKKAFDKIPSALQMISDALSISKYSDKLMAMKAEALLLLQRYEEIIQFCEETLYLAERNSVCLCPDKNLEGNNLNNNTCSVKLWRHHLIAKSYFCLGKLEEAHQFLKKYEQMKVMECRCGKQSQESISSFSMTISELMRLKAAGNEAFQSGKYLEAVEYYTSALLSNSESLRFLAVCFCNRAAAYQAMGQILDAIADCSLAIALDADYSKAFSRRSSLYELIGDYDQAANDVRRLIALLEKQLQENMSMPLEKTESIRGNLNQANLRLSSLKLDARKEVSSNTYLILGIEPSSSAVDIKKAYHKAALRHHPDKAGKFLVRSENISDAVWREITNKIRKDADYLFKIIGKAYSMLSDPTI